MNFHIAICDDELSSIQHIGYLVERLGEVSGHLLEIEKYPSSEAFLFQYAEDKSYDILLLDIEMNGVELARKIRENNREVQIIFITGYMDYIIEGYDVEALHYLIKPVDENKLYRVLDKATERLKKQEKALPLLIDGEMIRIPLYEIEYISVDQNYTTIHAENNYTINSTRQFFYGINKE
ncbi:LytTR family DNA-binding domain-containing protein [Proteiniborus sp. MB09-C3]|uniref:LytR/AlgR family response regulator transcription factor n=1 Tax=Proteiniborus sp. MB09-C3 TaxID=3050072 RepID=UPI0025529AE0|nr:LytTR family DNA-binding domain-containing protein [Proteiniborus sp. MB09-C3]WIV11949.1 LytTR family DNA-binding domain-containing protein [Proteiniborus sp. MB09-C3]